MTDSITARKQISGLPAFVVVWLGQIVSILTTQMSTFALTVWAYEKTGSATALGLVQVFYITPFLIISPIAGVMVDRYNRKLMMMVSDLGALIATALLLALQATGQLQIWHLYVASVVNGLANSFQWPAYSASISLMVPKEQLGRANGLMSLMEQGPGVLAPLLAGALLPFIHLTGILVLDFTTFLVALGALALVFVPQPPKTEASAKAQSNFVSEVTYGFRYIFARPSLLGLQLVFFFGNFFSGIAFTLLAPMVLARTNNNEFSLGLVQTAGAVGGILGAVIMSAWGGFKRRSNGVLLGWIWFGVFEGVLIGLGRTVPVWMFALFASALAGPLTNGSNQAIWQSKVAPDVQGRVFSARRLIAWFTNPITPIIAGLLADRALEPAMRADTGLSRLFGPLVGTGPGAGMALVWCVTGVCIVVVGLAGYSFKAVRDAETILPDHI